MMGPDIVALGASSVVGYIFKFIANMQKDSHDQKLTLMGAKDDSREKASMRGGTWIRRLIVVCLMGILVAVSLGLGSQPTNIVTIEPSVSFLWGLIETGTDTIVTPIVGGMYDGTTRTSILCIIGYYFGNSSASR